jgi:hypothetical protein
VREITLEEAFNYLRACEGVILEDRLIRPSLLGVEGDPENEFFYLSWAEEIRGEYIDFVSAFKEKDNRVVLSEGPTLIFINTEQQEEELTLLRPWNSLSCSLSCV